MVTAQVARADELMLVNVPFAFVAGNVTLPAGEYRVQKLDRNSGVLLINSAKTKRGRAVVTQAAQANEMQTESKLGLQPLRQSILPFASVDSRNLSAGRQLLKSPREKEIARSARLDTNGEITLVARLSPAKP